MSAPTSDPAIELDRVSRTFGAFTAVADVSLRVIAGEVVGIVGENGAGKSTLMKILAGVLPPSSGAIRVAGAKRKALNVPDAIRLGIALVHQELNLFDNLTVAANVFLGREPLKAGPLRLVDNARAERDTGKILSRLGAGFHGTTSVASLSIAERQLVEIAKALSLNARVLILDEPTSSLTSSETERLAEIVSGLRAQGVAIVLISHRLTEIERLADRVVVMRDGRVAAELTGSEIRAERMIRHMIGRDLKSVYQPPRSPTGREVLELRNVRTVFRPDQAVNLSLREGEILGLAGLIGSGRTELAETVFGLTPVVGGEILIDGKSMQPRAPRDAVRHGVALVPEDRKRAGVIVDLPLKANLTLPELGPFQKFGLLRPALERAAAGKMQKDADIRGGGVDTAVLSLSGGNQQKVALAKWLALGPRVLILDEPTRGVDVGAKAEIYRMLRELTDRGIAVLMISSDMEEVIGVSDRVAVMHEGRIAGELSRASLTEQAILSLAVGR